MTQKEINKYVRSVLEDSNDISVYYYNDKRQNGRRKIFKSYLRHPEVEALYKKLADELGWGMWYSGECGWGSAYKEVGMVKFERK